jgi:hypothetical protein
MVAATADIAVDWQKTMIESVMEWQEMIVALVAVVAWTETLA